jgi:hypothetical protein
MSHYILGAQQPGNALFARFSARHLKGGSLMLHRPAGWE